MYSFKWCYTIRVGFHTILLRGCKYFFHASPKLLYVTETILWSMYYVWAQYMNYLWRLENHICIYLKHKRVFFLNFVNYKIIQSERFGVWSVCKSSLGYKDLRSLFAELGSLHVPATYKCLSSSHIYTIYTSTQLFYSALCQYHLHLALYTQYCHLSLWSANVLTVC